MKEVTNISQSTSTIGGNAEENQNNSQLFETTTIEGTPFMLYKDPEQGYLITLGHQAVTEWYENEPIEKINEIKKQDWAFMVSTIGAILEKMLERKTLEILAKAEE